MNSEAQQYDVIVLGFDETDQETVKALQEQGKRVLYIPIDSQMMITLMAQKQLGVPTTTPAEIAHINVNQHLIQTPINETITYFFQPEELTEIATETTDSNTAYLVTPKEEYLENVPSDGPEEEPDVPILEEINVPNELVSPLELNESDCSSGSFEEPLTDTVELGLGFPIITPLAKECSLIDNRLLGIRGNAQERLLRNGENGLSESILPSYHLFNPIRIEKVKKEETEIQEVITETTIDEYIEDADDSSSMLNSLEIIEKSTSMLDSFETIEQQSISMPDSFETIEKLSTSMPDSFETIEQQSISMPDSFQMEEQSSISDTNEEHSLELDEQEELDEETPNHPTHLLDRDVRLRKKFSFNNRHQKQEPIKIEKTKQTKIEEEPPKMPDVFPLEPFSSRRRNKKNRLFSSIENTLPNPTVQPKPYAPATEVDLSSLSMIQDEEPSDLPDVTEQVDEKELETSADNLKIDTIEFEEPYGYNSFEDFFPSFSNNNDRKRQELDKIEKRKVALRGLHNLINNLG
jgi:hypothetical protein